MLRVSSLVILCLFLGIRVEIAAQESKMTVELSSDTILLGNYFELKFTVEDANGTFEAPDLSAFNIVGGPNTASSMTIINGAMTQSQSYSYYLEPKDVGNYSIPPAYLLSDGGQMESPPIDVIVIPNPDGIIQEPGRPGNSMDIFRDFGNFNQAPRKPSDKAQPAEPNAKKRKKRIF